MPYQADSPLKSKRLWSAVVLLVSFILANFGITVDEETQATLVDSLVVIVASGGVVMAIILNIWSKIREALKVEEEVNEEVSKTSYRSS